MSICIVLMPYLYDNVCFKLLGFLENSWNFIFSHSCTNPATNFHVSCMYVFSCTRGGSRILVTGIPSVSIQAIFLGDLPPNPKFPLQKNNQNTPKNASNSPLPQICSFPQSTKSRMNTRSNIWGRNRNWGRERARIDSEVQEKAGSPSPEKFRDLNWEWCKLVYIWSVIQLFKS